VLRVCRSVHLHTFKWINQLDAAINNRFIACRLNTAQHVSGILMPIIRSLSTAAAVTGLPYKKWKTNWCHCFNFIHISTGLYMFRAHRPIFRRYHVVVHTTIRSVSVPSWSRALYVVACLSDCFLLVTKTGHNIQSPRPRRNRNWINGCVNLLTYSMEQSPSWEARSKLCS
jgi:hypothetical protein